MRFCLQADFNSSTHAKFSNLLPRVAVPFGTHAQAASVFKAAPRVSRATDPVRFASTPRTNGPALATMLSRSIRDPRLSTKETLVMPTTMNKAISEEIALNGLRFSKTSHAFFDAWKRGVELIGPKFF